MKNLIITIAIALSSVMASAQTEIKNNAFLNLTIDGKNFTLNNYDTLNAEIFNAEKIKLNNFNKESIVKVVVAPNKGDAQLYVLKNENLNEHVITRFKYLNSGDKLILILEGNKVKTENKSVLVVLK